MPRRYGDLTPEQKQAVDAFAAANRTPEARAEEDRVRKLVEEEFPPAKSPPEVAAAMASLRDERERRGLSLADVAERSGLDRALISRLENGKVPNPTVATLDRYAAALGKRLRMVVCEAG